MISIPPFEERIIFLRTDKRRHGQYRYRPVAVPPTRGPQKDIYLYVNSPGGFGHSHLGDVRHDKTHQADVSTICVGMASFPGRRYIGGGRKKQQIRLAQCRSDDPPVDGRAEGGQATGIEITARHMIKIKTSAQ